MFSLAHISQFYAVGVTLWGGLENKKKVVSIKCFRYLTSNMNAKTLIFIYHEEFGIYGSNKIWLKHIE